MIPINALHSGFRRFFVRLIALIIVLATVFFSFFFFGIRVFYRVQFYDLFWDPDGWISQDFKGKVSEMRKSGELVGHYEELILDEEYYNAVFTENTDLEVDFAHEMLVVYTFSNVIYKPMYLTYLRFEENVQGRVLRVGYMENQIEHWFRDGATVYPHTRWFVLKLKRNDMIYVTFERGFF